MSLTASYLLEVSVRHIHGVDPGVDSFMDYLHILNDHEPPSDSNMSFMQEREDLFLFEKSSRLYQVPTKVFFLNIPIPIQLLPKRRRFIPKAHHFQGIG